MLQRFQCPKTTSSESFRSQSRSIRGLWLSPFFAKVEEVQSDRISWQLGRLVYKGSHQWRLMLMGPLAMALDNIEVLDTNLTGHVIHFVKCES